MEEATRRQTGGSKDQARPCERPKTKIQGAQGTNTVNLRKILHIRLVASIAHLHTPEDNVRMIELLLERQLAGPQTGLLAAILAITRSQGPTLLDEVRVALGLSGRDFERQVSALTAAGFLRWHKGVLIAAPFSMNWGHHSDRLMLAHPARWLGWKAPLARKSILRRPHHENVIDVLSPRWIGSGTQVGSRSPLLSMGWRTPLDLQSGVQEPTFTQSGVHQPIPCNTIISQQESARFLTSFESESHASRNFSVASAPIDTDPPVKHLEASSSLDIDKPPMDLLDTDIDLDADGLMAPAMIKGSAEDAEWSYQSDFVDRAIAEAESHQVTPSKRKGRKVARRCEGAEKPKSPAKRTFAERPQVQKAGADDLRFCDVWIAHQRRHEKWDENGQAAEDGAFGMAGAGSRKAAWAAWQSLSESQREAAVRSVERTLDWRAARGMKLQAVMWYLKDRSWEKLDKPLYPDVSLKRDLLPARPVSTARPAPGPRRTAPMPVKDRLEALTGMTASGARPPAPPVKPIRATFSEDEIAAYCREVGVDYQPKGRR